MSSRLKGSSTWRPSCWRCPPPGAGRPYPPLRPGRGGRKCLTDDRQGGRIAGHGGRNRPTGAPHDVNRRGGIGQQARSSVNRRRSAYSPVRPVVSWTVPWLGRGLAVRMCFERDLPGPPEVVWPHLTWPDRMNQWSEARVELVSAGAGGRPDEAGAARRVDVRALGLRFRLLEVVEESLPP